MVKKENCLNCGKELPTVRRSDKEFCSRACWRKLDNKKKFEQEAKLCVVCNKLIPYTRSNAHTCSKECQKIQKSKSWNLQRPTYRRKPENRNKYLLNQFGITLQQYDAILLSQGNGCAICGKTSDGEKALSVDHDHKTREIRGILCTACNHRLIGRHRNPELFKKAAIYLSQGTGLFVPVKKKKKRKKRVRRN